MTAGAANIAVRHPSGYIYMLVMKTRGVVEARTRLRPEHCKAMIPWACQ